MAEKQKRRPKQKKNFATHKNATHVTLYDPQGAPIPESVATEASLAILEVAKRHQLLINVATT